VPLSAAVLAPFAIGVAVQPAQLGDVPLMFDLRAVTHRNHDSVADVMTPVKLGERS
jgi:hypothetical protein